MYMVIYMFINWAILCKKNVDILPETKEKVGLCQIIMNSL